MIQGMMVLQDLAFVQVGLADLCLQAEDFYRKAKSAAHR